LYNNALLSGNLDLMTQTTHV